MASDTHKPMPNGYKKFLEIFKDVPEFLVPAFETQPTNSELDSEPGFSRSPPPRDGESGARFLSPLEKRLRFQNP